jgi:phenylalanyl-tRNA synthetase beta chain
MAIINVPIKEIEKIAKFNEETIEKINLMGTPVESVKENEIEVEILPNRPDMFSVQGFLRALKSYLNIEPGLKEYDLKKPEKNFKVIIKDSLKNIRPFTACSIVKNLKFNDEKIKQLIDLQERLHSTLGRNRKKMAIGIYPLEKINLPITFEARKPNEIRFIPLDEKRMMNGFEILEKHPTGREYSHLLTNLEKFPVFVDASGKILSMPPIINSDETGKITESTKDVFIECSGFDLSLLKKTLNIIVTTLADMNGVIYQMNLEYDKKETTPDLSLRELKISLNNINKLIGLNLKEEEISKLLLKMGYNYKDKKAIIPAWRTDILHEVDIIEDVAIAYGYNNLEPESPSISTIGEESEEEKFNSKIAEILVGMGLIEVSSYNLVKENEIEFFNDNKILEVENSKTEYKLLRPNLIIPILRIFSENKHNEYPQNIFEIGTAFKKENSSVIEEEKLIVGLCDHNSNFTQIKQVLESLSDSLGLKYEIKEQDNDIFILGRAGIIKIKNKEIAIIGEVNPKVLENFNIDLPVSLFELNLTELFNLVYPR